MLRLWRAKPDGVYAVSEVRAKSPALLVQQTDRPLGRHRHFESLDHLGRHLSVDSGICLGVGLAGQRGFKTMVTDDSSSVPC